MGTAASGIVPRTLVHLHGCPSLSPTSKSQRSQRASYLEPGASSHRMNCRPNACLASCHPAAQKGREKRPKSRPPPATAEMVQKATNEFQAMAKAPVATLLELREGQWQGGAQASAQQCVVLGGGFLQRTEAADGQGGTKGLPGPPGQRGRPHLKPLGGMSISRRGPRFFTAILLPAGRRRLTASSAAEKPPAGARAPPDALLDSRDGRPSC